VIIVLSQDRGCRKVARRGRMISRNFCFLVVKKWFVYGAQLVQRLSAMYAEALALIHNAKYYGKTPEIFYGRVISCDSPQAIPANKQTVYPIQPQQHDENRCSPSLFWARALDDPNTSIASFRQDAWHARCAAGYPRTSLVTLRVHWRDVQSALFAHILSEIHLRS